MLVEDEPDVVGVVVRGLECLGFRVDCIGDARRAAEMADADEYWLVVLGVGTDRRSGFSALQDILDARPQQPVLLVPRPLVLSQIADRIGPTVRLADAVADQRYLRVGSVTLDLEHHMADAGNGPVALSARECELLVHLMLRAGKVCSRRQLLTQVWDTRADAGSNVVDVYVRRLRRKLGTDTIETRRHAGYVMRTT